VLALDNVTAGYRGSAVLRDVSLAVREGTAVALLGPNGAGKTTLLRAASGVVRATSGRVTFEGHDISGESVHLRARRGLCDIPEGRGIFPSLTVKENLILQAPRGKEDQCLSVALDAFPALARRLRQPAGVLSGGEQQMLALSRAYANSPKIVLVDELSLGLAPVVIDKLFEFLATMVNRGVALLLVEQYITRALELASEVYVLDRGTVAYSGRGTDLAAENIFERYLGLGPGADHPRGRPAP
jgi:branched-chain amino acid transport system ATP-binding protein